MCHALQHLRIDRSVEGSIRQKQDRARIFAPGASTVDGLASCHGIHAGDEKWRLNSGRGFCLFARSRRFLRDGLFASHLRYARRPDSDGLIIGDGRVP